MGRCLDCVHSDVCDVDRRDMERTYGDCSDFLNDDDVAPKREWISVEERLPTWEDGKVLVFTKFSFSICERTVNGRWQGKHANWITHWMPLPEPPKGE